MVPVVGELFDGINALSTRSKASGSRPGLAVAAMVPLAGMAATAGKLIKRGIDAAPNLNLQGAYSQGSHHLAREIRRRR